MSGRQDYIYKIRYTNDLPAPECPPKLLKYSSMPSNHESLTSSGVLSSLFRKQNFKKYISLNSDSNLNDPLSLSLDLIELPGVFDQQDNTALHSLPFIDDVQAQDTNREIVLHEKDRLLLRNPEFSLDAKSKEKAKGLQKAAGVSFLRKTEYISNKSNFLSTNKSNVSQLQKKSKSQKLDPESQLQNVELGFAQAAETLSGAGFEKLRHPTKKNLRPVKAWSIIPDIEMMDQVYFSTKFLGSASLSRNKKNNISDELADKSNNGVNNHNPIYTTSIFKPITLTAEEWMSFFTINNLSGARGLKRKIDAPELDSEETFKYKFAKNYDLKYENYDPNQIKQISMSLAANKHGNNSHLEAKYLPIQGKLELKKKLATEQAAEEETEVYFDVINLSIRQATAKEEAIRDEERSKYDPYNYVAQFDDDDEESDDEKADDD